MKNFQSISLCLILFSIMGMGLVIAKNGHKITNLRIETDPEKPEKNTPVENLIVNFKLQSSTGISHDRIKLTVNNVAINLSEENFDIEKLDDELDEEKGLEFADITIEKPEVNFPLIENNLEVLYLLTAISTDPPQARKAKTVKTKDSTDNSGGGNNNSNGGSLDENGSTAKITPRLFRIFITEVNGNGMVSEEPRQFRLTAYHDERIIAKVDQNGYNAITHPIISNLKIYEQNPNNTSTKTLVENGFNFSLEGNGSEASDNYDSIKNELKTSFISEEMTIKEIKNYIFKLNLAKLVEKSGVKLEENIIKKDEDKINISAESLEFNNLSLAESSINFNIVDNAKKKYFFDSDSFTIVGTFNGSESITSFRDIEYFKQKTKNKTDIPKITNSLNETKKLKTSAENGSVSISGNPSAYTINIPSILSLDSSIKSLENKGFYDSNIPKTLTIPVNAIAKTSNGLDLIINGELSVDKILNFETVSINGSSL